MKETQSKENAMKENRTKEDRIQEKEAERTNENKVVNESTEKENQRKELLKPKIDIVFQCLFSKDNEEITKSFVEVLLEEKIDKITINSDKDLIRKKPTDKLGVLDLQLDINDTEKVDVEIQISDKGDFVKRLLWYYSKLYSKQMSKGKYYDTIKKVILVSIIDFDLKEIEGFEEMETIWKIIETKKREKILTDNFEMRIINLKKAKELYEQDNKNEKAQWMLFIDDPNAKEVSQIMEENKEIEKAVVKVKEMTEDEEMERLAFLREKAIMDENAIKATGERIGEERGRKLGEQIGEERGRKLGEQVGKKIEKEEIVKSMLERKMSDELIKDITEITDVELEEIKQQLKEEKN